MAVIHLIRRMSQENPTWGAPQITDELALLGHEVGETTVAKYMVRHRSPEKGQTWSTFLKNHMDVTAACDFFVVPTLTFKLLYGFVVLSRSPADPARERDEQPNGGVDCAADGRGVRGRRASPVSDPRRRRHLRRGVLPEAEGAGPRQFAEFDDPENYGAHDYNTIAINPNKHILLQAIALLHEFEHFNHTLNPPNPSVDVGDRRGYNNPCFGCTHSDMIVVDLNRLVANACEYVNGVWTSDDNIELCNGYVDLRRYAIARHQSCVDAGCPSAGPGPTIPSYLPCLDCSMWF
jgi:hypothetical protein